MSSALMKERQTCFQFKTSFAPCAVLQLTEYDLVSLDQEIATAIHKAPTFFSDSPVVIDLEKIKDLTSIDFVGLKMILINHRLIPIGIRGGSETQQTQAMDAGLPTLSIGKLNQVDKPEKVQKLTQFAKIVTKPIRSGMQVYAKDTDLIATSSVSPGAELMADGHIHVYGPLRGRVLAGVQGNVEARIFCCKLEAELVSIAGYYLTKEDMLMLPKQNGLLQIYLDDKQQIRIGIL